MSSTLGMNRVSQLLVRPQHEGLNISEVLELKVNQSDIEHAYIFYWQCQERTSQH
jgi:hypothetical protein